MKASKLEVVIILPELGGGGAERVLCNLSEQWTRSGHRVSFWLIRASGELLQQAGNHSLIRPMCPFSRIPFLLAVVWAFPVLVFRLWRIKTASLVFSSLTGTNLFSLFAARIAGFRGVVVREAVTADNRPGKISRKLVRLLYPGAAGFIAVSEDVKDDLIEVYGVGAGKISVIANPVDAAGIRKQAEPCPSHPFLDSSLPLFLSVGRLAWQKGHDVLLEAFYRVCQERDARLIIIGEGPERSRLQALARAKGIQNKVDLIGFLANPYPWMANCSVFVLPSRYEGYVNVLMEALVFRKPIVSTRCRGGTEYMLGAGRRGMMVPVDDAGSMADAMIRSLTGSGIRDDREAFLQQHTLSQAASDYLGFACSVHPELKG